MFIGQVQGGAEGTITQLGVIEPGRAHRAGSAARLG